MMTDNPANSVVQVLLLPGAADEDMESSCSSDVSFCSLDVSCFDDDTLCYDDVDDDDESDTDDEDETMSCSDVDCHDNTGAEEQPPSYPAPSPSSVASLLPLLIQSLYANEEDLVQLELSFPFPPYPSHAFFHLVQAIRSNTIVTTCSVSNIFFQSLSIEQRQAIVDAVCSLPSLKCLVLDNVFPDFIHTYNYCRCWKQRNNQYQQYQYHGHYPQENSQYYDFTNKTIEQVQISHIPTTISEQFLCHLVLTTVSNFSSVASLDLNFSGASSPSQEVLMRVALTALSHSRSLGDINFGLQEYDDGGAMTATTTTDDANVNFIMEVCASRQDDTLRVLKLRCNRNQLTCHSYMEVAQMLQAHQKTLKGLVLDTAVDNNSAITIANTLGRNSNLKALCLGTFDCQDKTRRDGLVALISQVLCPHQHEQDCSTSSPPSSSSLEYLSLVCQELDDQGVQQIGKALSQSSLRELILLLDNEMDNAISSRGVASLAEVLQVNETIEDFCLICNALDDDGVIALANVLKKDNRTLKILKLKCSNTLRVSPRGYQAIIEMLKSNTVLETFELSRCQSLEGDDEDDDDDDDDDDEVEVDDNEDIDEDDTFSEVDQESKAELDFYLKLNQSGIRNLHLNIDTSPNQFLTKLVSQRDFINCLFHMLSTNPSFVTFGRGLA